MSDMVDKVARALCIQAGEIPDLPTPYNPNADFVWQFYRGSARAAIEAMREPPETMWGAAIGDGGWGDCEASEFVWRWNLAIDAALKD